MSRFLAALRKAGLTNEMRILVEKSERLADVVVAAISERCESLKGGLVRPRRWPKRGRRPSVSPQEVAAAVVAIRQRGERVTQAQVAKELGKSPSYKATLSRTAQLSAAYQHAKDTDPRQERGPCTSPY
jgi:hypothetical protein